MSTALVLREPETPSGKNFFQHLQVVHTRTAAEDKKLLEAMRERDFLIEGELFRRVYGIDFEEHLKRYQEQKILPDVLRRFCKEFLAKNVPYFDNESRPYNS